MYLPLRKWNKNPSRRHKKQCRKPCLTKQALSHQTPLFHHRFPQHKYNIILKWNIQESLFSYYKNLMIRWHKITHMWRVSSHRHEPFHIVFRTFMLGEYINLSYIMIVNRELKHTQVVWSMDNNWKVDVVIFDALITSPTNLKAPVLEIKTKDYEWKVSNNYATKRRTFLISGCHPWLKNICARATQKPCVGF